LRDGLTIVRWVSENEMMCFIRHPSGVRCVEA
jgi:hypothetical protein